MSNVQVCAGVWKSRGGREFKVRESGAKNFPWCNDAWQYYWRDDGRFTDLHEHDRDLVTYISPLPKPEAVEETLAEIIERPRQVVQLRQELAATTAERNEQLELLETVNAACRSLVDELTAWKTHAKDLGDSLVSKRQEIQTLRKTLHEVIGQRDALLEALAAMAAMTADRNSVDLCREQLQAELQKCRTDFDAEREGVKL